MIQKGIYLIIWSTILSFVLFSCRKTVTYPEIPEIEYLGFSLRDTTDLLGNIGLVGKLVFSFVDGDGDIGLKQPPDSVDPGDPEYSNLFFTMFDVQNGILVEIGDDELEFPLYYRIPYLKPQGMDKSLTGEIEVEFTYLLFEYDTITYDFHITDRAGNVSNTESTPIFILPDLNIK